MVALAATPVTPTGVPVLLALAGLVVWRASVNVADGSDTADDADAADAADAADGRVS
ncbi:hypothetical protein [Streptomyces europaeiscabiei]|uniref:hypothetical protein n=1 Tax=Streptomyces europaeiscabiei TaxID=146819 RepID=UPI002E0D710E|nr:hypothetical protein OHB30_20365 [Streptomyces europaeiscabiei]